MISTASGDAPLRGLYATFSVTIPRRVQTTTATTTAGTVSPVSESVVSMAYAPTIMMSPWAKFSIFAIP